MQNCSFDYVMIIKIVMGTLDWSKDPLMKERSRSGLYLENVMIMKNSSIKSRSPFLTIKHYLVCIEREAEIIECQHEVQG